MQEPTVLDADGQETSEKLSRNGEMISKEQQAVIDPKEQQAVVDPKEQQAAVDPKEQQAAVDPKEQQAVVDPKEQLAVVDPKEQLAVGEDFDVKPTTSGDNVEGGPYFETDESDKLNLFQTTYREDIGNVQVYKNLPSTDLQKSLPRAGEQTRRSEDLDKSIYADSSDMESDALDHSLPLSEVPSENECGSLNFTEEMRTNQDLLDDTEKAQIILNEIKKIRVVIDSDNESDKFYNYKNLREYIDNHIQKIATWFITMKYKPEETKQSVIKDDPSKEQDSGSFPFRGACNLKELIKRLSAKRSLSSTLKEPRFVVNPKIIQAEYNQYCKERGSLYKRIKGIVKELAERRENAEKCITMLNEFRQTLKEGNTHKAKTTEELKEMYKSLKDKADDCDDYLTSGVNCLYLVQDKLNEFVTENRNVLSEMSELIRKKNLVYYY